MADGAQPGRRPRVRGERLGVESWQEVAGWGISGVDELADPQVNVHAPT